MFNTQTLTVQIGNSDGKLTQNEWAHFIESIRKVISDHAYQIHFQGGSDWDAPWQNACWVCEVAPKFRDSLIQKLCHTKNAYRQESIALTWGETDLLR